MKNIPIETLLNKTIKEIKIKEYGIIFIISDIEKYLLYLKNNFDYSIYIKNSLDKLLNTNILKIKKFSNSLHLKTKKGITILNWRKGDLFLSIYESNILTEHLENIVEEKQIESLSKKNIYWELLQNKKSIKIKFPIKLLDKGNDI